MNGTHRNNGVWIAVGPGSDQREAPARLTQVAAWLALAIGFDWISSVDGDSTDRAERESVAYDAEEEAMVAERLRTLGYLE